MMSVMREIENHVLDCPIITLSSAFNNLVENFRAALPAAESSEIILILDPKLSKSIDPNPSRCKCTNELALSDCSVSFRFLWDVG